MAAQPAGEERTASIQIALITTAEAARRLSMSRERVRQLLEARELEGLENEGQPRDRYVDSSLGSNVAERERVHISIQEIAAGFGFSTVNIRAWIRNGRLESFQVEGDRRVYLAKETAPGS